MQTLQTNSYYGVFILLLTLMISSSDARKNDSSPRKSAVVVPQTTTTVKTTMNSSWTWANPIFRHDYNSYFCYYDVFEIVAPRSESYTFSTQGSVGTYGYLYRPPFNPENYEQDLLDSGYGWGRNGQFEFSYDLQMSVSYYLVVTTDEFLEIGQYQVIVTGTSTVTLRRITVLEPSMPNIIFKSTFTNLQPQLQGYCNPDNYYSYDIFSIVPQATGNYTIETVSIERTNIRVYSPSFNPLAIVVNIIGIDESSGYQLQQQLRVNLVASNMYYLVVSKFDLYLDGDEDDYRLTFRGPSQFTMTKLTDTFVSTVKISSSITKTSPLFSQEDYGTPNYYYKVFVINVRQLGIHTLLAYSSVRLTGYLYENNVTPRLFERNQIARGDDFDTQAQFGIKAMLTMNTDYYFVVSTYNVKATGAFNITVVGPQTFNLTAVPDGSNSTVTLSSSLTSRSSRFRRCQGDSGTYYYRLFNITVPRLGLYTIKTVGSMDTFGCLYRNRFDPGESDSDLFSFDDQGAGKDQFAITTVLHPNAIYYLAVSTNRENRLGSFNLAANGPANMNIRAGDSA